MKNQRFLRYLIFIFVMAALFHLTTTTGLAQAIHLWPQPQRIPNYGDDTNPPYLVTDQNGTVHAFTSQPVGDDGKEIAIVYNQWTLQKGWTNPIDVVLSPLKHDARLLGAFLDQTGMMHIIFFGGDETEANIYYTKGSAVKADQAQAWLEPFVIGKGALVPETAGIAGDNQGHLVVVYAGAEDGKGLYFVTSADDGDTWTDPAPLFFTASDHIWPTSLQMYLGQSGWLHAVWNIDDVTGQGRGVYYAHMKIGGNEWSEPFALATVDSGLGTKTPTLIEYNDTVFAVFYNANMGGHLTIRRSTDEGQTWLEPTTPFPQIGMNNVSSFAVDSNHDLHLFFAQRITGSPDIHGVWHSILRNNVWIAPEAVVSGPQIMDTVGSSSFAPIWTRATTIQGNVLLVTWRTDFGIKANGVWYSYKELNAPVLPSIPLPVPPTPQVALPTPTAIEVTAAPTPTPSFLVTRQTDASGMSSNPALSLVFGMLPVAILISLVMVYQFSPRRHH